MGTGHRVKARSARASPRAAREFSNKMLEIGGRLAINRNGFSRARMNKLKLRSMKSNAVNQLLRRFIAMVFSVANDGVADGRKLRADLVLQSCDQLNPDERSVSKYAFDGIAQFGPGRLRIFRRAQLLIHSFTPKIMYKRACRSIKAAAHDGEISPHGSVGEKLLNQRVAIAVGLGKQQNSGSKTINAMHDQSALSLQLQFCGQQRQGGRSV